MSKETLDLCQVLGMVSGCLNEEKGGTEALSIMDLLKHSNSAILSS